MPVSLNLIQISDTHFGTEQPQVTQALIRCINQHHPDLLVWSGDITQRARASQYRRAALFLGQLRYGDLICIPGNHDAPMFNLPVRLLHPYYGFTHYMKQPLKTSWVDSSLLVVAFNSCNLWHYKNGRVSAEELERVEGLLSSAPDTVFKLVVCHHPFDVIKETDEENLIRNAKAALDRWQHQGLDMVMGGHIHHQFCHSLQQRYTNLSRNIICCQAGTAISSRVRGGLPNSFMQLQLNRDKQQTRVLQWDYIESADEFECTAEFTPFAC